MKQKKSQEVQRSPQEMKALSGLLQAAERKNYLQDWHEGQRLEVSLSLQMKSRVMSRKNEKTKTKAEMDSRSLQKRHERDRLQQLIRQPVNNQQQSLISQKELPVIVDKKQHQTSIKFAHHEQLRSFHSHLTFYHSQRDSNKNGANSSLTFYGERQKPGWNSKDRYVQQAKKLSPIFEKSKVNSPVVYFKANKAQTIRELLNQMKISKQKNNQVILNSTHHEELYQSRQQNDLEDFNHHQIKILNKYKKFIPFQQDEAILFNKIKEGDNIWKRKFKQSWQRKKQELEGRKTYFKRLIVRD